MLINRCWNCMGELGNSDICPHCGFNPDKHQIHSDSLRPGTILHGKYLVGNVLGRGGYGITYIGFDLTLEMKVAIKEYFPADKAVRNNERTNGLYWRQSDGPGDNWRDGCTQFLYEARKMAKINSIPEIVSVRDTFEENNTAYIVMDFVPGQTLKDYVQRNGCLSYAECVELLLPLIDGLDKVHRQGIIHRDISPDNLMITPSGKVYLLDLGAAKDMKDTSSKAVSASKIGFSPLEQNAGNGRIGPWTDVYALAASIYYCVYGKVLPSSLQRYDEDTLNFKGHTKKRLTGKQKDVLKKGLALTQEQRYQNAMEFYVALKDSVKKSAGKKIIAAVSALVLLAGAAAGGYYLYETKPWLPTVEIASPNTISQDSHLAYIEQERAFFVDLDNSLVAMDYDKENMYFDLDTLDVIYVQDDTVEDDYIEALHLVGDTLYFTHVGVDGYRGTIMAMDTESGECEEVFQIENSFFTPLYTRLSDGTEYFYYLEGDGIVEELEEETESLDGDEILYYLYRYNISDGTTEQVLEDAVNWFTVYDKYIYYSVFVEGDWKYYLYRATLAGDDPELLDDVHDFYWGFIVEEQLYLLQSRNIAGEFSDALVACDVDGVPLEEGKGLFSIDWRNLNNWNIDSGWLYYNMAGSDELWRIRLDGTENTKIMDGYQYYLLSHHNGILYFQDGIMDDEEVFHPYQAYWASDNGSSVTSLGFELKALRDEQGFEYVIDNGEARPVGYVGTETDVILPMKFNGYPLNDSINWDTFYSENVPVENLRFYAMMPESELTYTKSANGITITGYSGLVTGAFSQVAIPSEIEGTTVVAIGEGAFKDCTFTSVYLPKELQEIGESAFEECNSLKHVVFPDTLKLIDDYAFAYTSFEGKEIYLPDSIENLGLAILMGAKPSKVHLPDSLNSVTNGFLACCGGKYEVSKDHKLLKSVDGVIMSKGGTKIYAFPYDATGAYTIPDGVTEIKPRAFYGTRISSITFPDGLTTIGAQAFKNCKNLTKIVLPRSVTELGDEAFAGSGVTDALMMWGTKGQTGAFDEDVKIKYYGND